MPATAATGSLLHIAASAEVKGAAADVYRMIADYRNGHPRIVPPRYFRNLEVDHGGYGAGTTIRYDLLAFGTTYHARAKVTEPEPGRVLVETDLGKGAVTTFVVDPLGSHRTLVTITTDLRTRAGVLGAIERVVTRRFFRRVYAAQLARLDQQVQGARSAPARPTLTRGW
jgi:Polyketide cyclase / dehydrase and lipid transport